MSLAKFKITEKLKEWPIQTARPEHFAVETDGEIELNELIRNPNWTQYCFDFEKNGAFFVYCPEDKKPEAAPFYYMAQYDEATHTALVPMGEFMETGYKIDPIQLIFVHSTGRCGSTLVSKALSAVPAVHSLSEPDDGTQLTFQLADFEGTGDQFNDLIRAAIQWRCKPRHGEPAKQVAIKTRAEVMAIAERMVNLFPTAKNIFLYRDGDSWAKSYFRLVTGDRDWKDMDRNLKGQEFWAKHMALVREYASEETPLNALQMRACAWCQSMEEYLRLRDLGVPVMAARYNEFGKNPLPAIKQLFDYCGIEVSEWGPVEAALAKDSQEGTIYDREAVKEREKEYPEWLRQSVLDLIASRPRLKSADVILPGTIQQ